MAKSNNRWDVIYETVDEQAHKIVQHFAAQNVDYKTALMVKRNHKKICAMEIRPTPAAPDAASAADKSADTAPEQPIVKPAGSQAAPVS